MDFVISAIKFDLICDCDSTAIIDIYFTQQRYAVGRIEVIIDEGGRIDFSFPKSFPFEPKAEFKNKLRNALLGSSIIVSLIDLVKMHRKKSMLPDDPPHQDYGDG